MDKFDLGIFEEYTDKLRKSFLRVERPQNDWRVILIGNFIILILFVVFSFYLFIQISKDEIFISDTEEDVSIDTLNRALLNETLEDFRVRVDHHAGLEEARPIMIDPAR